MTLPAIAELCKAIDEWPDDLRIRFPGGAELRAQLEGLPPSLLGLARATLGQANAALSPMVPVFNIIETVVAVKNCIEAIPDALGPPPNPSKMMQCVPVLLEKVEALIALLPPASVLATIVDLLDAVIGVLHGTIAELRAVIALLARVAEARKLVGIINADIIDCGQQNAEVQLNNISRALGSMESILELINVLTGLAGLAPIPKLGALPGDPELAIGALEGLAGILYDFRSTIPVS